jgi:hypothetical protein
LLSARSGHATNDLQLLAATQSGTNGPCGAIDSIEESEDVQTVILWPKKGPYTQRQKQKPTKALYRLSIDLTWITKTVHRIAATRAKTEQDIRLRTWILRDREAEIFHYCREGDMYNVQRLPNSGDTSAYDYYVDASLRVSLILRSAWTCAESDVKEAQSMNLLQVWTNAYSHNRLEAHRD